MNFMVSRPKKSTSSKARRKRPVAGRTERRPRRARAAATTRHGREFRAWRDSLPTPLERETLLMPEAIAESVVQEAERLLEARLPEEFASRLAAKAEYLYPRHKHFRSGLNRPGNGGRDTLRMFMRHWTAGWLKRECFALYKGVPRSFAQGIGPDDLGGDARRTKR